MGSPPPNQGFAIENPCRPDGISCGTGRRYGTGGRGARRGLHGRRPEPGEGGWRLCIVVGDTGGAVPATRDLSRPGKTKSCGASRSVCGEDGGVDETRTRDLRRDRPAF